MVLHKMVFMREGLTLRVSVLTGRKKGRTRSKVDEQRKGRKELEEFIKRKETGLENHYNSVYQVTSYHLARKSTRLGSKSFRYD